MALLVFEKAQSVQNRAKQMAMVKGGGGELVHCEFILECIGYRVCSSWAPKGVQIRDWRTVNPDNWKVIDLGYCQNDKAIYEYFTARIGEEYSIPQLVTNLWMQQQIVYKNKCFCSEICYECLVDLLRINLTRQVPSNVSPQKLYDNLIKLGYPSRAYRKDINQYVNEIIR